MKLFRGLSEVAPAPRGRALAVGTFDGVHRGHREVIRTAVEWGQAHDTRVAVVTFDPHPLQVLRPDDPPQLLTPVGIKADLVAALGVDELVLIPFTAEFSRLEAEEFCRDVLRGSLGARHVSVGENFRFGHEARGDARLLASWTGFETSIVPLVEHGGGPVSSSRIRELLARGEVSTAVELLGAPFQLEGMVVEGDGRGRSLEMPTANVTPAADVLVPATGIYAGFALDHAAAISVGSRPTFKPDSEIVVEAHLIDFEGDLYDRPLRIAFLERLRDEVRFDDPDELVEQMRRDVQQVRKICERPPSGGLSRL
jgi:riboflavin kinase / FMN adenylyltransferase